jgi:hypothetical protein
MYGSGVSLSLGKPGELSVVIRVPGKQVNPLKRSFLFLVVVVAATSRIRIITGRRVKAPFAGM